MTTSGHFSHTHGLIPRGNEERKEAAVFGVFGSGAKVEKHLVKKERGQEGEEGKGGQKEGQALSLGMVKIQFRILLVMKMEQCWTPENWAQITASTVQEGRDEAYAGFVVCSCFSLYGGGVARM